MLLRITTAIALLASFVAAKPCTGQADYIVNCNIKNTVALTFDDGPRGDGSEKKIAQAIKAQGGSATFYLNGQNYACIYDHADEIRWLYDNGFELGSHTWSHANVAELSRAEINEELEKLEAAFINILGVKPKTFRAPYGELNQLAVDVLRERGYTKILGWTDDSGDSTGNNIDYQKGVMRDVVNQFPNPRMVLQHSTSLDTANVVTQYAAPLFKQKGYKMVNVNKCLTNGEEWPYTYVRERGERNANWHC